MLLKKTYHDHCNLPAIVLLKSHIPRTNSQVRQAWGKCLLSWCEEDSLRTRISILSSLHKAVREKLQKQSWVLLERATRNCVNKRSIIIHPMAILFTYIYLKTILPNRMQLFSIK